MSQANMEGGNRRGKTMRKKGKRQRRKIAQAMVEAEMSAGSGLSGQVKVNSVEIKKKIVESGTCSVLPASEAKNYGPFGSLFRDSPPSSPLLTAFEISESIKNEIGLKKRQKPNGKGQSKVTKGYKGKGRGKSGKNKYVME